MTNIVHLTHTDINSDNRIFKEVEALSKIPEFQVLGIGIYDSDSPTLVAHEDESFRVISLSLFSKKINFFIKPIKSFFVLIEFLIRASFLLVKFRPKIIHCHDTPILLVGLFFKFIYKSKLIYDAHELESNRNALTPLYQKIILFIEKITWKHIDLFITVSPAILNWYEDMYGPAPQNNVILNTPDMHLYNQRIYNESKYFHRKFSIPFTEKVFLSIGILGPGRGIPLCLSAFKSELVSSHIVFIGWGEMEDEIKSAAKECSKIHYHASIHHNELVGYISQADYGICLIENISLSDYLCLPNKLFEYLFSGLPVIGSNFPEISRILDHLNAGIAINHSIEETISAINLISEKKIVINKDLLPPFSWNHNSKLLTTEYSKLLKL